MKLAHTLWIAFDKKQPDYPEFITWIGRKIISDEKEKLFYLCLIFNFNNHLQKTLTIEMLVAMKDGEVLKDPLKYPKLESNQPLSIPKEYVKDYQQAMESVLYEGFDFVYFPNGGNDNQPFYKVLNKDGDVVWLSWNDSKYISTLTNQPITLNWWKEVLK